MMKNKLFLFGLIAVAMFITPAFAYTIGDGNCSGTETSGSIDFTGATSFNNSDTNITLIDASNIFFEGYNDSTDWFPEGLWTGFRMFNTAMPSDYEYIAFDVDGLDWGQDMYSGQFVVAFCNTTTIGIDDIEVCQRYYYNLDGLTRDFLEDGSSRKFMLTPTACRYWNKSEAYYLYDDSTPCDYPGLNYSEMRVFAWAEYGALEPFTITIGNMTYEDGEIGLTSYDCADEVTVVDAMLSNYSSGYKMVTGIMQTYPTTQGSATYDFGWEAKKSGLENAAVSGSTVVIVDENAYAAPIYYSSGMNITEFGSYRDGYHNVTLRFLYDATSWNIDDLHVHADIGVVDEMPVLFLEDYVDMENYNLTDEGTFYMNVYSKYHVVGYPIHNLFGIVNYCEEDGYTFDGTPYTYSFCYSLVDFTDSSVIYEQWLYGYGLAVRYQYDAQASDLFYGRTLLGTGIITFTYLPSGDYIYDRPSLTNFDVMGDRSCGYFESGNSSFWNYTSDCAPPGLNIWAFTDAIGGFFQVFNQSTALASGAMTAANSGPNVAVVGSIVILSLVFVGFGYVWSAGKFGFKGR